MRFAPKLRTSVTGALAVGAAALVSTVPAHAGHFGDDGGYVKKVVIIKKHYGHPGYGFGGGGLVKKVVIVKKPTVHAGYGYHSYGYHPRTTVVVKKHFGGPSYGSYGPGYGSYGPRPVGFYGHSRFDDDF